jgi:hypothetical protein
MADSLNAINAPRTVSLKTTVFIAALLETGYPTARAGGVCVSDARCFACAGAAKKQGTRNSVPCWPLHR